MNGISLPVSLTDWLARVLEPEYAHVQQTYHHVVQLLSIHPSLRPKTDVYTYESGQSELLLCIFGNIPAKITNIVYRIPVEFWIPKQYPASAPIAYVRPTEQMIIYPGNHVDINGKCYHPYLSYWAENSSSNLSQLVDTLSDVFSKEPPVYASPIPREPAPAYELHNSEPLRRPTQQQQQEQLPPLPPKPAELLRQFSTGPAHAYTREDTRYVQPSQNYLYQPPCSQQHQQQPLSQNNSVHPSPYGRPSNQFPYRPPGHPSQSPDQDQFPLNSPYRPVSQPFRPSIIDSELSRPVDTPQPPRPPNPEKLQAQADLQQVFQNTVSTYLEREINVDEAALSSTHQTLDWAEQAVKRERIQLKRMIESSENNIKILNDKITAAKNVISDATSRSIPHIDELVSAETIVYNQLYELVAEDRAIDDSLYVLDKALDHDIIQLEPFMKHTRSLAREQFLKRALVLKIAYEVQLA